MTKSQRDVPEGEGIYLDCVFTWPEPEENAWGAREAGRERMGKGKSGRIFHREKLYKIHLSEALGTKHAL